MDRRIQYKALPHQLKVLRSPKKLVFMGGGIASGKTDVGSIWSLTKAAATPKGVLGLIVANTYSQLVDSTVRNFYKKVGEFGLSVMPGDLPRNPRPFSIFLPVNGQLVEVLCRSLDNYENLSGLEVGWIWADEVFQTSKEAIDLLLGRMRDKRVPNQCLMTTTLDEPGGWMHEMVVEKSDPALMDVVYATTYANAHNLPAGFIEGLKSIYTKEMFERMVMARWVSLSGSRIYYAFDRNVHLSSDAEFDPALPILWSHDFNIGEGKPMSSCLGHLRKGPNGPELHIFDEIILASSDTNDAIVEFKARPWIQQTNSQVIIYGDAAGRAKDTRSKTTDYALIANAGYRAQKVPLANPAIRERHNTVNTLLRNARGAVRMKVHPRCKALAKGFEVAKLRKGAQYLEDDNIPEQHVTTAAGYLACAEFAIRR